MFELPMRFLDDLVEARTYWCSKQTDPVLAALTTEQWVMRLLREPVYALIGEKRVMSDGKV